MQTTALSSPVYDMFPMLPLLVWHGEVTQAPPRASTGTEQDAVLQAQQHRRAFKWYCLFQFSKLK